MTFKECIYDIREALKLLTVDSDLTDRQIAFLMRNYRAVVIRQFITNNPGEYRDMLTQSLYMGLELVDTSRFKSFVNNGFTILGTKLQLPNIIGQQLYKEIEVRTVGILDDEIEMLSKSRATEAMYAPIGFIYGFREDDGKLYFISKSPSHKNLSQVIVTTILEDPEQELVINGSNEDLVEYPITSHLWVTIKDMVIQHLTREMSTPIDIINNKKDDQLAERTSQQN